jgi:hypothetical protein
MWPNCALSLILAVGLAEPRGSIGWPAPVSTKPIGFAETQPPSPSDSFPPGQIPTAATWPQFLESVRQIALAYTDSLPDFICMQHTLRRAKLDLTGPWETVDQMVVEVSYHEKGERYKVLAIDNKPPSPNAEIKMQGFSSEGDFGSALYLLFVPESNASFQMEGLDRTHGRRTVRAHFYVPRTSSKYDITLGDQKVTTAYSGRCWIDLASRQVVRLECVAQDIPASSPVRKSSRSTEYDLVEIAGAKYWLPVRALAYMQLLNDPQIDYYKSIYGRIGTPAYTIYRALEVENEMDYRHYRKFGTEVRLAPE